MGRGSRMQSRMDKQSQNETETGSSKPKTLSLVEVYGNMMDTKNNADSKDLTYTLGILVL